MMTKKFTGFKAKGLKIFSDDEVMFDVQKTRGTVKEIDGEWFVVGEKGHKWSLEDSVAEGITVKTTFNRYLP